MSFNRENITWQSEDGTWNRGFYSCFDNYSSDDEDYDPEWDVDYDYDSFEWVSTGHATEQGAWNSWNGANPGGGDMRPWNAQDAEENARLDDMAFIHQEQEKRMHEKDKKAGWGYMIYRTGGPRAMDRPASRLAKIHYEGKLKLVQYKAQNYINPMDSSAVTMGEVLKQRLENNEVPQGELSKVIAEEKAFRAKAEEILKEEQEKRAAQRRMVSWNSYGYSTRNSGNPVEEAREFLAEEDEILALAKKHLKQVKSK